MSDILEVIILIAKPPVSKERFNSLLKPVSKEKQERIKKIRSFKNAQNCLLGDVLVRSVICRTLNLANSQVEFEYNKYGKPYLRDNPDFHFNLSHSGHYIALAVDDEPVGIDIERLRAANIKIANRFFAPDEIEYIKGATGNLSDKRFFEIWTKKESRIKRDGMGLSAPLQSFSVLSDTCSSQLYYHDITVDDKTICHVCTEKQEKPTIRISETLDDMIAHWETAQ